jgi:hypothetical protein
MEKKKGIGFQAGERNIRGGPGKRPPAEGNSAPGETMGGGEEGRRESFRRLLRTGAAFEGKRQSAADASALRRLPSKKEAGIGLREQDQSSES